jgi:hypothetical protein
LEQNENQRRRATADTAMRLARHFGGDAGPTVASDAFDAQAEWCKYATERGHFDAITGQCDIKRQE